MTEQVPSDEQVSAISLLREWLLASDNFDMDSWVRKVRDLVEDGTIPPDAKLRDERSEADRLSRPASGGAAEQPAPVGEVSVAPQPVCAMCDATVRVLGVEPNGWIRLDSHQCRTETPKTDAAAVWASDFGIVVDSEFARAQERRIAELESANRADAAAATAHRACCGVEHDPVNGKLHGYCVVCGVPWPCETAQYFIRKPKVSGSIATPDPLLDSWGPSA
jgi:hypothetical protein